MIISGKINTPQSEIDNLKIALEKEGLKLINIPSDTSKVFGVVGDTSSFDVYKLYALPWVNSVTRTTEPYKQVSRAFHPEDTVIEVKGIKIGGNNPLVFIAGPCAVESSEQIDDIAKAYRHVYQCGTSVFNALRRIEADVPDSPTRQYILDFIRNCDLKIVAIPQELI